jgi:1-acyl-sn-glycerol-3-phosphate acyltransferase
MDIRLLARRGIGLYLHRYHRHEILLDGPLPDEQCLIISNHGFGGVVDLNVLCVVAALDRARTDRPVTALVHQIGWTMGAGPLLEALGCRPGGPDAFDDAVAAGHHVLVFPGGDIEASRPYAARNEIRFCGRTGYARMAIQHDLPIVPIVTAGAGESLLVLSDGQRLATALGLDRRLRVKAVPVSVSVPWGLNVGLVGLLPYAPLPTKLKTAVLSAMRAVEGESPAAFAARIESLMQQQLDALVAHRKPLLG